MGLFQKTDPNILRILTQVAILNQKVDKIMSTNNNLASQLQTVAANLQGLETKIEADLTTLASTQATALADFKAWLSNPGSAIDPATLASLNEVAAKFSTVDTTLTTLASTVQSADPGAVPAAPVNG